MTSQPLPHRLPRVVGARGRGFAAAALTLAVIAALTPGSANAGLIPAPGPWPTTVNGAANPLIGTAYAFNGGNATANAQLRVWFPSRGHRRTSLTRVVGLQTRLRGRLRNRDNHHSINGAMLTVAQQEVYSGAWTAIATLRTDRKGVFRGSLPAGYHRRIAILYYPASGFTVPLVSRRLLLRASSRVHLLRPYHRRRAYRFDGRVSAGRVPPPASGLLIALQVRNQSGRWVTARLRRTTASGRFRIRYSFPSAGALHIRIVAPAQSGWPLYAGASRTRLIHPR